MDERQFYDKLREKDHKKKIEVQMKKNKNYSNEYKFKVSLEMIRRDLTIAEIISNTKISIA